MAAPRSCARRMLTAAVHQKRHYSAPTDGTIPPNKAQYVPASGSYPKGFWVGSAHAQVKQSNTKFDDLALIASEKPCAAALVTTQNAFQAAPVGVSRGIIGASKGHRLRGLIVNSGCANAVTGTKGRQDALVMSKRAQEALNQRFPAPMTRREEEQGHDERLDNIDLDSPTAEAFLRSLVMSTGVIGQCLPIDRITNKIPALVDSLGQDHDHWLRTARAICTTDTFPKLLSRQFTLPGYPGSTFSIAGMTKGAGMIHPNMATLLGAICTDVPVNPTALRTLLKTATHGSFNCITVDGDTSTNDSVAIFANGMAAPEGSAEIRIDATTKELKTYHTVSGPMLAKQSEAYKAFSTILNDFMQDLAKLIVRDGEGATKFVTIKVRAAASNDVARRVAMSIAQSSLVKTALYGKDANWGRILCAIGYAPGINQIKPQQTSVSFIPTDGSEELKLLVNGEPQAVDEARAKVILEMEDLEINVTLRDETRPLPSGKGNGEATVYTCDFSHEYVTINGDYRT